MLNFELSMLTPAEDELRQEVRQFLVEELGEGVKPMQDRMQDEEEGDDTDHGHGRDRLDPAAPLGLHEG